MTHLGFLGPPHFPSPLPPTPHLQIPCTEPHMPICDTHWILFPLACMPLDLLCPTLYPQHRLLTPTLCSSTFPCGACPPPHWPCLCPCCPTPLPQPPPISLGSTPSLVWTFYMLPWFTHIVWFIQPCLPSAPFTHSFHTYHLVAYISYLYIPICTFLWCPPTLHPTHALAIPIPAHPSPFTGYVPHTCHTHTHTFTHIPCLLPHALGLHTPHTWLFPPIPYLLPTILHGFTIHRWAARVITAHPHLLPPTTTCHLTCHTCLVPCLFPWFILRVIVPRSLYLPWVPFSPATTIPAHSHLTF